MRNFLLLFVVMALLLAGCSTRSTSESFLREDVDFSFVQRIAVLPFQNNSSDDYAIVRTRNVTMTHVLTMGFFDVVDKDLVDSALRDEVVSPGANIDPLTLKRLGSRLRVQAFMMGTVDVAGMNKTGSVSAPEMALTLRLVEAESGMVLWQASGHNSAESVSNRLLGIAGDDSYEITVKLVKSLLRTLQI